ncbi:MAG: hypothetical protein FD160_3775 [Caulobacteraceae bacterium]|nr:MAG: hypothetical protein FD160_3775 [Caulobacteraceae bacterium]
MAETGMVLAPQAGVAVQDNFGGAQIATQAETANTAMAAASKAAIEARWIMAIRRPRDMISVQASLNKEAARPSFAKVAEYRKPLGKDQEGNQKFVIGPSIRFAEAAARCMGNLYPQVTTVFDTDDKRIVNVSVTDLENNITYSKDITISKTVERKYLKKGQQAISTRVNSYGDLTHLVRATDDEVGVKEAAMVSKAMRELILRLLPGDIKDEAIAKARETMDNEDAKDPDAARKAIVDSFGTLGVTPEQLTKYVGHPLAQLVPKEIKQLRLDYAAIYNGEQTWAEIIAEDEPAPESKPNAATEKVKAKLEERKAAEVKPAPEPDPAPSDKPAPASKAATDAAARAAEAPSFDETTKAIASLISETRGLINIKTGAKHTEGEAAWPYRALRPTKTQLGSKRQDLVNEARTIFAGLREAHEAIAKEQAQAEAAIGDKRRAELMEQLREASAALDAILGEGEAAAVWEAEVGTPGETVAELETQVSEAQHLVAARRG